MARPRTPFRQALKRLFRTNHPPSQRPLLDMIHVARTPRTGYSESRMSILPGSHRGFFFSLVMAVLISSCAKSKTQPRSGEESVSSTASNTPAPDAASIPPGDAAPSCGVETQLHGGGYDDAARTCLWNAYRAGRPAELVLKKYTVEGDPIIVTLRIRSGPSIEVHEDNRDRFGGRGVRSSTCTELSRGPSTDGRSGFIVRGCRGSVQSFEVP